MQPDDVHLWYFKLTSLDLTAFIVWNIKVLQHGVAMILKLENQSLWQKLNSFGAACHDVLRNFFFLQRLAIIWSHKNMLAKNVIVCDINVDVNAKKKIKYVKENSRK